MKKYLLLLLLVVCSVVFAEEYTLDNLIEVGLEKSISIQQEKLENKNSSSYLRSSFIDLLPSLYWDAEQTKIEDTDWNKSSSLYLGKTFSVNDPSNEPAFFSIYKAVNSKKKANLSLEQKRKQIAFDVFSLYLNLLEAQKNLEINKKNLKLQQKIFAQIQVQYDSGEKSLLELKQSEVSLIDYRIAVSESEDHLSYTRSALFEYLNIEDEGFDLREPEINYEKNENTFQSNFAIRILKYDLKNNKLNLIKNTLHYLPDLTVSYYIYNEDTNHRISPFDIESEPKTLSIEASFSVFDIFEETESFFRNKGNRKSLKMDLEKMQLANENELYKLQKAVETLSKSNELYLQKMQMAENNLEMAQEQFKLGLISLTDLDRTKLDHQNTQLSYNNKHYELLRKQEEINLLLSDKILNKW